MHYSFVFRVNIRTLYDCDFGLFFPLYPLFVWSILYINFICFKSGKPFCENEAFLFNFVFCFMMCWVDCKLATGKYFIFQVRFPVVDQYFDCFRWWQRNRWGCFDEENFPFQFACNKVINRLIVKSPVFMWILLIQGEAGFSF